MRENEKTTWPSPWPRVSHLFAFINHLNATILSVKQPPSAGGVINEQHTSLKKCNILFTVVSLNAIFKNLRKRENTALIEQQCKYQSI